MLRLMRNRLFVYVLGTLPAGKHTHVQHRLEYQPEMDSDNDVNREVDEELRTRKVIVNI